METNYTNQLTQEQMAIVQRRISLENRFRSGIGWFYWIAALSLVNSFSYVFGGGWSFSIGLGVTQVVDGFIDALVMNMGQDYSYLKYFGLGIDVFIAAIFLVLGLVSRKKNRWPIITGLVLYGLDAVVMLLFSDYIGAGFHLLGLFGLWSGFRALKDMGQTDGVNQPSAIETVP